MKTKKSEGPLRGERLAKAAMNHILAHPDEWDQTCWHSDCGTTHCFGGTCQILSGKPMNKDTVQTDAREALGISIADADWLFSGYRSLGELYYFVAHFNESGFDRDGFDRDGFDRDGFDRDGFDRDGFDRDGRDRDGNALKPFDLD